MTSNKTEGNTPDQNQEAVREGIARGEELFGQGYLEAAEKVFLDTLKLDPKNKEIYNNIGCIFFQRGDMKKAEEEFLMSFSLDQDYLPVIDNLAEMYKASGNHKREVIFRARAVELEEGNAGYWNALALCWVNLKDLDEVRVAFEKSLAIEPSQDDVRKILEEIRAGQGAKPTP